MATTYPSRNLSISINRDVRDVYNFVSVPENFPRWASGLGRSLKRVNGGWVAETPEGPVQVRFTERNEFGILDHWVSPKHLHRYSDEMSWRFNRRDLKVTTRMNDLFSCRPVMPL